MYVSDHSPALSVDLARQCTVFFGCQWLWWFKLLSSSCPLKTVDLVQDNSILLTVSNQSTLLFSNFRGGKHSVNDALEHFQLLRLRELIDCL